MTTDKRLKILEYLAEHRHVDIKNIIQDCVFDELRYANMKAGLLSISREPEIAKILGAYNITKSDLSEREIAYIQRIISFGNRRGLIDHYDLNDSISYIGEYYDGEPTEKYRQNGRYSIDPIITRTEWIPEKEAILSTK